jgi:RIO kinase 1
MVGSSISVRMSSFHCNSRPSPRLKDAEIPESSCASLYTNLLLIVRRMYHSCKLVHADLSEYNILYHNSALYIIDVSQSVEHDHPHAWDFLRNDLKNVEEFWGRRGVKCLGLRRAFEFITKDKFLANEEEEEDPERVLQKWLEEDPEDLEESSGDAIPREDDATQEDKVFMQSYIPRTLNEVYDPERDLAVLRRGEGKTLIYAANTGILDQGQKTQKQLGELNNAETNPEVIGSESHDEDEESSDEEKERDDFEGRKPRGHKHEDREAKKVIPILLPWLLDQQF